MWYFIAFVIALNIGRFIDDETMFKVIGICLCIKYQRIEADDVATKKVTP